MKTTIKINDMQIEEAIKVLHDLQKYRRDQHVPAKYPMPNTKRIGEAIDCAIHNLRTCVQVSRVVEAYEEMNNNMVTLTPKKHV